MSGSGNGTREESWLDKGADRQLATGHGQGQSTRDSRDAGEHERGSRTLKKIESRDDGIPVALLNFR